jgi:hypothetical protein
MVCGLAVLILPGMSNGVEVVKANWLSGVASSERA